MFKTINIIGIAMFFILSLFSFVFSQESMTITTYYPSPYGSYRELRAQRMAIGDTYYGSTYCWPPDTCTNQIDANADLVVEGNVGIGDTTPAALLTVGSGDLFQVVSTGHIRTIGGTAGSPVFSFTADTNTGMYQGGADILRFSTAGADRLTINSAGNVGIGTTTPTSGKLDVRNSAGNAIYGYGSTGVYGNGTNMGVFAYSDQIALEALSTSGWPTIWADNTSNGTAVLGQSTNGIGVLGQGNFAGVEATGETYGVHGWGRNSAGVYGGGNNYDFLGEDGEYAVGGQWSPASDRDLKENFTPVNDEEILNKISELNIMEWNYKKIKNVRHIAPTAQDFYSVFKIGKDEKHISQVDPSGVALIGIKALNKKVKTQAEEIKALKEEIESLKKHLNNI